MGNVGDYIGSGAARTAAHQHNPNGDGGREPEQMDQPEGHGGHDGELEQGPDGHVLRLPEHIPEIIRGQAHAHAEHDDAQEGGDLGGQRLHEPRLQDPQESDEHHPDGHVTGAEAYDCIQHGISPPAPHCR